MIKITLQRDKMSNIRLVHQDGTKGAWTGYDKTAILRHEGKTYIAATMQGRLPRSHKVYQVSHEEIETADQEFPFHVQPE